MSESIVGVDVGGTFTDVVRVDDGTISVEKFPTVAGSPHPVIEGARTVGVSDVGTFNLATTAGLNAVITRRLPKVGFLTTYGHRDILDRGTAVRPLEALTDVGWRRSFGDASGRPIVPRYLRRGVRERLTATGNVMVELDEAQLREELAVLARCNVQGVAVCLLHAYLDDRHEQRVRELVHEVLGDIPCSISSDVSPLAKEYSRASTTVIDLLMKVIYADYTATLHRGLSENGFTGQLNFADSRANLLSADIAMERPYQLVTGGPAGGTVASAHFGEQIDDRNLVCADVGGTSCDISLVLDGQPWSHHNYELEHDLVVNAPCINVVTLGAGGGSVIAVTPTGTMATGPESAGSDPGPACYGQGGDRPTITDAALLSGVITSEDFLGGRMKLDPELSTQAFESLDCTFPLGERVRQGWDLALHNIAEGIREIATRRGIDIREFSLMAFGAAGPMLLPSILPLLQVRRVLVPPHPGLFSAVGLAIADQVYSDHRGVHLILSAAEAPRINTVFAEMEGRLRAVLGPVAADAEFTRSFDAHLEGNSWETPFVPAPPGTVDAHAVRNMIAAFHTAYEDLNGTKFTSLPIRAVTLRVNARLRSEGATYPIGSPRAAGSALPSDTTTLSHLYREGDVAALACHREDFLPGDVVEGPAVVRERLSTTFVPRDATLRVEPHGALCIERAGV